MIPILAFGVWTVLCTVSVVAVTSNAKSTPDSRFGAEYRKRVAAAIAAKDAENLSFREAARRFGLKHNTLYYQYMQHKKTGQSPGAETVQSHGHNRMVFTHAEEAVYCTVPTYRGPGEGSQARSAAFPCSETRSHVLAAFF